MVSLQHCCPSWPLIMLCIIQDEAHLLVLHIGLDKVAEGYLQQHIRISQSLLALLKPNETAASGSA